MDFQPLFNDQKTRQNIEIKSEILNLPEAQMPSNPNDLEVTTIVPGKSKINTKISKEKLKQKIIREKLENKMNEEQHESIDSDATISDKQDDQLDDSVSNNLNEETESVNDTISDIDTRRKKRDEKDKHHAIKRAIIIEMAQFEQKGYKVPKVSYSDSIEVLEAELDKLREAQRYKIKLKFFEFSVFAMAWLIEKVLDKIGYGTSIAGFSDHIRETMSEYHEHFRTMIQPTYEIKPDGTRVKVENPSIINRVSQNPEANLIGNIAISAIFYCAANRYFALASTLSHKQPTAKKQIKHKQKKKTNINNEKASEPKEVVEKSPDFNFLDITESKD